MKFGLSDEQLRQVQAILSKYPAITEAVVFGSRAMGNYREASDVDIALKGNVAASMVGDVKYTLEEDTYLPFFFDIIAYGIIDNSKLKEHIDKYGVALYRAGWRECRLGDYVLINFNNIDKNYPHREIEYLDTGSITQGKIEALQHFQLPDAPSRAKRIVKDNDIVLSMVRPIQRHYGFLKNVPPNMVASTGFVVLTCKDEIDPYFLYSFLTQEDTTEHLDMIAEGSTSTYPAFTSDVVENLSINLPPLPEQRTIAAVLSSLGDKIDLLHRQNKTLEGMAEAVYTHFFIDNRKVSWKECPLNELANHQKISIHPNKNPASLFYHYSIPAFDEAHMPIPELGTLIQSNKYAVTKNTILFSKLNPHKDKRVWLISSLIDANSICSTEFQVMKPKVDKYLFFLYGFISHPGNYNEIAAGVGGTSGSHQRIDPEVIFTFKCFLPDDTTLTEYNETIEPIFTKIHHNRQSIQTLVQQRDSLLPKLMSGEVRVKV